MRRPRSICRLFVLGMGLLLLAWGPALPEIGTTRSWTAPSEAWARKGDAPSMTPVTVDAAIEQGVAWLVKEQRADGTWGTGSKAVGHTVLALYALHHAGVHAEQGGRPAKALRRGWRWVDKRAPHREGSRHRDEGTYGTSLLLLALHERDRELDRPWMQALVDVLVRSQVATGQWDYRTEAGQRGGDNSNTQFALLALGAAHGEGLDVPAATLASNRAWWQRSAQKDGAYGYASGGSLKSAPSGSMTAAAIACMAILQAALDAPPPEDRLGPALQWLADHWDPTHNPGPTPGAARQRQRKSGRGWLHYHLWTVERAMVLAGQPRLGEHDWYREGAAHLLATQKRDGSWRSEHPLYATCFALLFLTRAADPPRAFTQPRTSVPKGPTSGHEDPEAPADPESPAAPSPTPEKDALPPGTLADWLDVALPPGELPRRVRLLGAGCLRTLVRALDDPDKPRRNRAWEALSAVLPAERLHGVDRHPLPRGRLQRWLRVHSRFLVLVDGVFRIQE